MRSTAACFQHLIVVGVHRQVGVYITVAGMHMQRDEYATTQHALMNRRAFVEDRLECDATEDVSQRCAHLSLPRDAYRAVLQYIEHGEVGLRCQARIQIGSQVSET